MKISFPKCDACGWISEELAEHKIGATCPKCNSALYNFGDHFFYLVMLFFFMIGIVRLPKPGEKPIRINSRTGIVEEINK